MYTKQNAYLTLARQDVQTNPAIRLALLGNIDLQNAVFPKTLSNAVIALSDLQRSIIPANDDAALGTGAILLKSEAENVNITVTAREGNRIFGNFEGLVFTTTGIPVAITNGTFQAHLEWQ
jgi:hypothetical protein